MKNKQPGQSSVYTPEKEIPSYYKPNAFPIVDHVNPEEFYLIYSAFPKIAKYDMLGNKLWERKIPESTEMDSVSSQFYRISNQLRGKSRVELKKYVAGVSDTEGNFYLALGKYYNDKPSFSLWIHKFDKKGTLITRYKLISKRVNLSAIFDIDSDGNRIFVITGRGEIRAYSLD